ncbi:MAG TPA: hypothetical protein VGB44_08365, partial [Flavobacterium sp.]
MKKQYTIRTEGFSFLLALMLCFSLQSIAQVRVPFTQRTSQYTPTQPIYHIKGDFAIIGNTNLTLQNYTNETPNSLNLMRYVDIDSDPTTLNSSSAILNFSTENGAVPSCSNVLFAGLYWTGRASNLQASPTTFTVEKDGVVKNFDKRMVSIKGPNATGYTSVTAGVNDIYYPENTDEYMYSAFAEVTDYVRANGIGAYTVADIALREGNGGITGYYGGWSLIVVYENDNMKYRDVTIFDGHAFVPGNVVDEYEIQVSGFNTVQAGPVHMKLGVVAGEGDREILGDFFQIRNAANTQWVSLSHELNEEDNFFNSSIYTEGNDRNPNLLNNTGIDIGVLEIPNEENQVIINGQTSTRFRYGSTQDTYSIFAFAMAVDAYIPDVEGIIDVAAVDGTTVSSTPASVTPGQEITYTVQIKNLGTEALNNSQISIPIPYNTTYVAGSASTAIFYTPAPSPNTVTYQPTVGVNGSLVWNIGTLPLLEDTSTVLGELTFTLAATTDCTILQNNSCNNIISVNGEIKGAGAISGVAYSQDLIQGYTMEGACQGDPIPAPINIALDAADYLAENCGIEAPITAFTFCNPGDIIAITEIIGAFPVGTLFYNQYPIQSGTTVQYTINNPFPATVGTSTYFAVAPGTPGCVYQFTITVGSTTAVPTTTNIEYCQGDVALPLVAVASQVGNTLYFYTSADATAELTLIPSTTVAGTFTYYVAEGPTSTCIGPLVPLIVTVNATEATFGPIFFCEGQTIALPTTSLEGVTGTFSPATVTGPGTYTFTPDAGQCFTDVVTIEVTAGATTATFAPIVFCEGQTITLPTTSLEGVTGTFSPATVTAAGTYTFTPDAGQCFTDVVTVEVTAGATTATFAPIVFCEGQTVTLPTTSLEGVTGTFSPATVTGPGTYTFTPDAGQCFTDVVTVEVTA